MKTQTLVILPALNEEQTLPKILQDLRSHGFTNVLVVDDGSVDKTAHIAKSEGADVLKHEKNRGVGAALQSGIDWGVQKDFQYFLTIDADGQHFAEDLEHVLQGLKTHDIVIGSRFLGPNDIPWIRHLGNKVANIITGLLWHVWVSDSQSGLRGFRRDVAQAVKDPSHGYEFLSIFLGKAKKQGFKITEVPIAVHYSAYSLAKGQSWRQALRTFHRICTTRFL